MILTMVIVAVFHRAALRTAAAPRPDRVVAPGIVGNVGNVGVAVAAILVLGLRN